MRGVRVVIEVSGDQILEWMEEVGIANTSGNRRIVRNWLKDYLYSHGNGDDDTFYDRMKCAVDEAKGITR